MRPSLYYGFCGTDTAATVRFFKDADTVGWVKRSPEGHAAEDEVLRICREIAVLGAEGVGEYTIRPFIQFLEAEGVRQLGDVTERHVRGYLASRLTACSAAIVKRTP